MNDIEALLQSTGERWRAAQPAPPDVNGSAFVDEPRTFRMSTVPMAAIGAVAVVIVSIVILQFGGPLVTGRGRGGGPEPSASTAAPAEASQALSPDRDVTKPIPAFVPPEGELIEPPAGTAWFGRAGLYTALDVEGETWSNLPRTEAGWGQKTFWWSVDWRPDEEPYPQISVAGERLDGPGTFEFGPGTNASAADIGTAMLVGVAFPEPGCWKLTATYQDARLYYTVRVTAD